MILDGAIVKLRLTAAVARAKIGGGERRNRSEVVESESRREVVVVITWAQLWSAKR
jgi:hypothetical protein